MEYIDTYFDMFDNCNKSLQCEFLKHNLKTNALKQQRKLLRSLNQFSKVPRIQI